jgi:hypothetical protein
MSNVEHLPVALGSYKLKALPGAEHWAVRVGDCWYEIVGARKNQSGSENEIDRHSDDSKFDTIKYMGDTQISHDILLDWSRNWLKNHPCYSLTGDNCQLFVRDVFELVLGKDLVTQNSKGADLAFWAGVSAIAAGIFSIAASSILRGSHR